jgi:hypothetical protein
MIITIVIVICLELTNEGVKINKGYTRNGKVSEPTLTIEKVTFGYTKSKGEMTRMAKYTAVSWYDTQNSVDCERVTFYDEIGKYNVGDELILVNKIKK